MQTNAVPHYDSSVNTTGCCARFNPEGWDGQVLRFEDKPFVRASTHSVMHVPVDMGRVFGRVFRHMEDQEAMDIGQTLVLSRDRSAWNAEHLFATTKPVDTEENVTLSGDFVTKVFEGPYRTARDWYGEMQDLVRSRGSEPTDIWFFYTTCPKCAKAYGKNYVVGVGRLA
ncbi:hydrolase [Thetidibacter halocola]|uniref:Uncharacterized protein n=1 Tax=Thetidibacter halocola TaxID=2827239 RepID=A0A8J8B9F1_9RHOB|nr:hydrolase [Thetidibacter halocola]MBS0126422.1 hypothetical protein [Thetidibacter halocola]